MKSLFIQRSVFLILFILANTYLAWPKILPALPLKTQYTSTNAASGSLSAGTSSTFYRSAASGDWSSPATWEISADSVSWSAATTAPSANDSSITIQAGHIVTISTAVLLDETTIEGTLQILTNGILTINNGQGNDINIENNGVLQVLSSDAYSSAIIPGTSAIEVSAGGKIEIGDGALAVGSGYETFATSNSNVWDNAAIFEWNSATAFVFSGVYFPTALTTKPILRVSKVTGPIGEAGDVTVNGLFTVNTNCLISGNGDKNFRNGISGNSILTLNDITGIYKISSAASEISGNLTLELFKDLHIKLGTTVTPGSVIIVSNAGTQGIIREEGDFIIASNAVLDMGSTATFTNSSLGNILVGGTFATANHGGFTGTGSTIPSNANHVIIQAGAVVEYNAAGDQVVTSRDDYQKITFSGSGIKTPSSGFNPTGTVTISGTAIVDAKNYTFGNDDTNLTMLGTSKLITGGTGTKPDMAGIYTLNAGTTIEFNNMGATLENIRLTLPDYYNIVVSGTGVGTTSLNTPISMQSGGTFTVKNGAVFKLKNFNGFSGGVNTAIGNGNNPAITLEDGAAIEYNGSAQTISNQQPYPDLIISGSGDKTAPAGILTINGNFSSTAGSVFIHNNGTVLFGNARGGQIYTSGNAGCTFYNLKDSNISATGLLVNSDMAVEGALTVEASSALTLNGNITLKSNDVTTASVPEVPLSATINYGTGLFIVERYFTAKRAWRFLSVPDSSVQSIKEAWQEGATSVAEDPLPGFGTQITDNVTPDATNGFDYYSANGPSVKKYNSADNAWVGIPGTNTPVTTTEGLMTFVRGDRSVTNLSASATPVILRSKGKLYIGTRPDIIVPAGNFASIGNPYAAALDMRKIITQNVDSTFYIWDPKLTGNGFGAYQTFKFIGDNFYPTPGSGSYGNSLQPYNYIQSGQAFFVRNSGIVDGTVSITENAKANADSPFVNNTAAFRPAGISTLETLRTTLYSTDADTSYILDGVLNFFEDDFSNAVDKDDAVKAINFGENIGIKRNNFLLSIEKRHTISGGDTIPLNLTNLKAIPYRFTFNANNFNGGTLIASLQDSYLQTQYPIDLAGITTHDFARTADSASWNPSRFRILFSKAQENPLPVTFTTIKAYKQNLAGLQTGNNIKVDWAVENEKNIKEYRVQRSGDGKQFVSVHTVKATGNNSMQTKYAWLDENVVAGANFYRIISVDANNKIQYSTIVTVMSGNGNPQILATSNPLDRDKINLQFIDEPANNFNVQLFNASGQLLSTFKINHSHGSSIEIINIDKTMPSGIYVLKITSRGQQPVILKIAR